MTFTLPDCPGCSELTADDCPHRQAYKDVETFIAENGAGQHITIVDGCKYEPEPDGWWKGRYLNTVPGVLESPDHHEIRIYSTACKYWGWDMLTSILIHEFGHALLRVKDIKCSRLAEEEQQANHFGYDSIPAKLIPAQYWQYRKFCAESYHTPYSEEGLRNALNQHRLRIR